MRHLWLSSLSHIQEVNTLSKEKQPPIALEQWLSIVLALPSHRSSNEGHREFGAKLVQFVMDEIPSQYADDETARAYFNHMLIEVAWAIRGFSSVRDRFQNLVNANSAQKDHIQSEAGNLDNLSPFKAESLVGNAFSVLVGAGGAGALSKAFPSISVVWIVLAILSTAYGVHLLLTWFQSRAVRRAISSEPEKAMESWVTDARPRYVEIARAFLEKATIIQEHFYPTTTDSKLSDDGFDELINRALSLNSPTTDISHDIARPEIELI